MLFPSFGQASAGQLTPVKRLMEVLRQVEKKSLTSYEQQVLLLELYEQTFQIFDHENAPAHRPLSLVELHPKEIMEPFTREARLMQRFAALKIGDMFNMSFPEFLNQSRERVEMMLHMGETREQAEERAQASFENTLNHGSSGVATPFVQERKR